MRLFPSQTQFKSSSVDCKHTKITLFSPWHPRNQDRAFLHFHLQLLACVNFEVVQFFLSSLFLSCDEILLGTSTHISRLRPVPNLFSLLSSPPASAGQYGPGEFHPGDKVGLLVEARAQWGLSKFRDQNYFKIPFPPHGIFFGFFLNLSCSLFFEPNSFPTQEQGIPCRSGMGTTLFRILSPPPHSICVVSPELVFFYLTLLWPKRRQDFPFPWDMSSPVAYIIVGESVLCVILS